MATTGVETAVLGRRHAAHNGVGVSETSCAPQHAQRSGNRGCGCDAVESI